MNSFAMGDLAQFRMLSGQGTRLRAQMNQLSVEATTGLVANQTERLKGNYVQITGIEARIKQLESYKIVSTEQQVVAQVMQTSLDTVTERSSTLAAALLSGSSASNPMRIDSLGEEALAKLDAVLSALNARVGERSVFSGQAAYSQTFGTSTELLDALELALDAAGANSPDDITAAVDSWFADPAGFEATMYHGADPLQAVPVGPDQTAQIDVTGMDSALVETIKGMAMAALLTRDVMTGSDVGRSDLAKRAGESLSGSQQRMAVLTARLGTQEAAMKNASTRNDAEKFALEEARLGLLSVDQYETAAKFQEAQGQLSTLYTLTARASRLSLVDYL